MIAVDDLNDWIGCMGGNPDTITPNMDRLAARGTLFTNAHCVSPACVPSRTAIFSGLRPSTTGIYQNWAGGDSFRKGPVLPDVVSLPQHFMAHGYHALGTGKLLHSGDSASWHEYWPSKTRTQPSDPMPPKDQIPLSKVDVYCDWGAIDCKTEDMGDWKVANWAAEQLKRDFDKPFFMGCGIYRPHVPWYLPQKYLDKFPIEKLSTPEINENDYDDIPDMKPRDHFGRIRKLDKWKEGIQHYLACINFADECVGNVLDALDASPYKDNTIVILWSDHGWHLGEKLHWRKFTLWEEATQNILMVSAPGVTKPGSSCPEAVSLLDLYPTLIDLCGLADKPELQGTSLLPQLRDPKIERDFPVLTTHGRYNNALRSKRWRYILNKHGNEELYDHDNDPNEWTNLADNPEYDSVKKELAPYFPKKEIPPFENLTEFSDAAKERRSKERINDAALWKKRNLEP